MTRRLYVDPTISWQVYWSGITVLSVKLFGWAVLKKVASHSTRWQAIGSAQRTEAGLLWYLLWQLLYAYTNIQYIVMYWNSWKCFGKNNLMRISFPANLLNEIPKNLWYFITSMQKCCKSWTSKLAWNRHSGTSRFLIDFRGTLSTGTTTNQTKHCRVVRPVGSTANIYFLST